MNRRIGLQIVFLGGLCLSGFIQSAAAERIRIIGTNDIHSYLRPIYYRYLDEPRPWGTQTTEGDFANKSEYEGKVGGLAYAATVIKRLRSEAPEANILVDSGDTWHGAGISYFDRGESMVKIMNAMHYDAMVPGNWEFIYDRDHLLDLIDQADFPVVTFNLVRPSGGNMEFVRPRPEN